MVASFRTELRKRSNPFTCQTKSDGSKATNTPDDSALSLIDPFEQKPIVIRKGIALYLFITVLIHIATGHCLVARGNSYQVQACTGRIS